MNILPQNYRAIPAKKVYLDLILALECVFFILLGVLLVYLVFTYNKIQQVRAKELQQLKKWEQLISKYPNYPEVYYNAALHEARVGDAEKAILYVQKSLRLNPNFAPGIALQEELTR